MLSCPFTPAFHVIHVTINEPFAQQKPSSHLKFAHSQVKILTPTQLCNRMTKGLQKDGLITNISGRRMLEFPTDANCPGQAEHWQVN